MSAGRTGDLPGFRPPLGDLPPADFLVRVHRPRRGAVTFTRCPTLREAERVARRLRRAGITAHVSEAPA